MRGVFGRSRAVRSLCVVAVLLLLSNAAPASVPADVSTIDPVLADSSAEPGRHVFLSLTFDELLFVIRLFSHLSVPGG